MSTGAYIVLYAICLGCVAASALKGKYWLALFGVIIPIFAIVAAVRPAKPGSYWARARATYFPGSSGVEDDWQG